MNGFFAEGLAAVRALPARHHVRSVVEATLPARLLSMSRDTVCLALLGPASAVQALDGNQGCDCGIRDSVDITDGGGGATHFR